MGRVNLFLPVHVKTLTSQRHRALLTARKLLQEKAHVIENDIRGLLRNFGLKVGAVGVVKFDERIQELVEGMPELVDIMGPLLTSREQLREAFMTLHRNVLSIVRDNTVCRRLMTIPGVGPRRIAGLQQYHRCSTAFQERPNTPSDSTLVLL
jgi:transposase